MWKERTRRLCRHTNEKRAGDGIPTFRNGHLVQKTISEIHRLGACAFDDSVRFGENWGRMIEYFGKSILQKCRTFTRDEGTFAKDTPQNRGWLHQPARAVFAALSW